MNPAVTFINYQLFLYGYGKLSENYLKLADRLGEYIVQGSCSTCYEAVAEEELVKLTWQMRKKGSPRGSCSTCYDAVAEEELMELAGE